MGNSNFDIVGSAQKLARNPLGIIALFLLLVYGVAALAFGLAAKVLTTAERLPIVWFLVAFPVLVLVLFGWLVSRHHTKLYAPSDYQDKDGFFRALTASEKRERLEAEAAVVEAEIGDSAEISSSASGRGTSKQSAQITRLVLGDLRAQIVLAEDLVFRELESELQVPILRQVTFGRLRSVDGLIRSDTGDTVVEIKFTSSAKNWPRVAAEARYLIERVATLPKPPRGFLLAMVASQTSYVDLDTLRVRLEERVKDPRVDVSVRLYDFEQLKLKYGVGLT